MPCGWRLTAVVALLICLRAVERYTRVRQHGIVSHRAAAPHSLLNPQRGPKFVPRALTAAELAKLPPHARPLPLDEARALWRPEIGHFVPSLLCLALVWQRRGRGGPAARLPAP